MVVTVEVLWKVKGNRLCSLKFDEKSAVLELKAAIIDKLKSQMIKILFITIEQCVPSVVGLTINGAEADEQLHKKQLKEFGMRHGSSHQVLVSFRREYAFWTKYQFQLLQRTLDLDTEFKYPDEIIAMAISMAPDCSYRKAMDLLIIQTDSVSC